MKPVTIILAVALVLGLSVLDTSIVQQRPKPQARKSVAAALAGEFRTVFANLLWIKAEQYHHECVAHHRDWTKNTDGLGLIRIITRLDRHFEEAYATGARMMLGMGRRDEAKEYLEEGVQNNPNSMMLHDELGTLLAIHIKDYKGALFHLKRAYLLGRDDFDRRSLRRAIRTVERLIGESSRESRRLRPSPSAIGRP